MTADADVIDALERAAARAASSPPSDAPPVLFHFTSIAALTEIVRTNTIWASITDSSNDAGESSYVTALATELINNGDVWPDPPLLVKMIPFFFSPENVPQGLRVRFHPFAASFCDTTDDSSLWQLYGGGGTGAAVGFSTAELPVQPFRLLKVVYNRQEQKEMVKRLVKSVLQVHIERLEALVDPNHRYFPITAHIAAQGILAMGPLMKAPAFSSEREWRLVTFDIEQGAEAKGLQRLEVLGPINARARDSRLIAYKEVVFPRLPLSEIVLGAASQTGPDDYVLRRLLPNVPIARSHVRVRPK